MPFKAWCVPGNICVYLRISLDRLGWQATLRRLLGAQLLYALDDMIQPSFDLAALAPDEQIYAVMLRLQDLEERLAEGFLGAACALAGDRNGFVGARRRLVLDQVFEVVVVDVNCAQCRELL